MWLALILLSAASYPAYAAKILGVLATDSKSRYSNIRNVADELASRGHEVLLIVPDIYPVSSSDKVKHSVFKSPVDEAYIEKVFVKNSHSRSSLEFLQEGKMWKDLLMANCKSMITHVKEHQQQLKEYDFLFGDSPPFCHVIISEFLRLRRVDIKPAFAMRAHSDLSLVSYIPNVLSSNTQKMNFTQRIQNLLYMLVATVADKIFYGGYNELKREFDIMPERPLEASINMAEMSIIMGNFALEYPQPILPGTKFVGPLTVKAPKPLPSDLEQFINGAGDKGTILFSLGTQGDAALQNQQVEMVADVFGRLEQRVIWRFKGHIPTNLSSNIKVLPWIPQNDILDHKSTKVFISHTGHNGLYEAAFYGVPLVCVPIYGDQYSNCAQARSVGMAIGIDIKTATADEIYHSIKRVLEEPSFKGNATRISRLLRDSPRTPVQQAADWIEYVHRHKGAKHLRPEVYNLHWYQYYLLDVFVFILNAIVAFCFAVRLLFRMLCKIIAKGTKAGKNSKRE